MLVFALLTLFTLTSSRGVESPLEHERKHFAQGHNEEVDHEAFLGSDMSHSFDSLTPQESKKRLLLLLPKVDTNKDLTITEAELGVWVRSQIMDYVKRDAQKALPHDDINKDGLVSWAEYVTSTYGEVYLDEKLAPEDDDSNYVSFVKRDKVRFDMADADKDSILNFEEFSAFQHPEEFKYMSDIVTEETLEDMDEDKDGRISLREYIGDFLEEEEGEEEDNEWLEQEKSSFINKKDKNKDGYLDRAELAEWVIPQDMLAHEDEAKHLIKAADDDKDGSLSYDEVLNNYNVFVGSQATDYGRSLHEEL